jgi:hypothetical protein
MNLFLIAKPTHKEARREANRRGLRPGRWRWVDSKEGARRWRALMGISGLWHSNLIGAFTQEEIYRLTSHRNFTAY